MTEHRWIPVPRLTSLRDFRDHMHATSVYASVSLPVLQAYNRADACDIDNCRGALGLFLWYIYTLILHSHAIYKLLLQFFI